MFATLFATLIIAAEPMTLQIERHAALPKGGEVRLKLEKTTIQYSDFTKSLVLNSEGPYRIDYQPKGGQWVTVIEKWKAKPGKNTFKLMDHVGMVNVLGDDLPRADRVVLTAEDDPGPGEKSHKPIQSANDYKIDLIVPAGFYSVWIVPANGAKSQRIADRIRVQSGRETRVPE